MAHVPHDETNPDKSPRSDAPLATTPSPADTVPPPIAPPPECPGSIVTRGELAQAVGKDERTIRRWERTLLAPAAVVGVDGVHRFDMQRVTQILEVREKRPAAKADAYDGAMAREVFALFDEATHPVDIVKQTGFDPRAVRALYTEWLSLRGGVFVPAEILSKIAALPELQGPNLIREPTAEKLLACIERSIHNRWVCTVCERRNPEVCSECARDMPEREARRRAQQAETQKREKEAAQRNKELEEQILKSRQGRAREGR
jgi:ribosome-binding protein aMBF1 (putative translation factor)